MLLGANLLWNEILDDFCFQHNVTLSYDTLHHPTNPLKTHYVIVIVNVHQGHRQPIGKLQGRL